MADMQPLRRLLDPQRPLTYGIVQAGENIPGGVPYIRPVDMTANAGVAEPVALLRTSPEIAAQYRRSEVRHGDLVLSIGPSYGKVMIVPEELSGANLTQGTARVALGDRLDRRWAYWYLQSQVARDHWNLSVAGGTFAALNLGPLGETPVPLWPVARQRRIADFLDDQVARIDNIIAARREQSALLVGAEESELEHVLWDGARGVALRRLGTTVTTGPFGTVFSAADFVDDGIPMINPTQLTAGRIMPDLKHSVSRDTASRLARHQLRRGDIITGRKGDIGRSAVISDDQDGWVCGSDAIAIHADRTRLLPRFLDLVLHLPRVRADLVSRSPGATMPSLNEGMLLSVEVPELSMPDQERAEFIGSSIRGRYGEGRKALFRSTGKLDELKRSLITAAVTGDFDVSSADGSRVPVA